MLHTLLIILIVNEYTSKYFTFKFNTDVEKYHSFTKIVKLYFKNTDYILIILISRLKIKTSYFLEKILYSYN